MARADQGVIPPLPFLGAFVEATAFAVATPLRIFAVNAALLRNLHEAAVIPVRVGVASATGEKGENSVVDVERDGRVGLDLKFGTISFEETARGTFAVALVDVIVGAADMAPESDTRVQMNVRVAADPETDSIVRVTETVRSHIVRTLRAAADTLDAASARNLLFDRAET